MELKQQPTNDPPNGQFPNHSVLSLLSFQKKKVPIHAHMQYKTTVTLDNMQTLIVIIMQFHTAFPLCCFLANSPTVDPWGCDTLSTALAPLQFRLEYILRFSENASRGASWSTMQEAKQVLKVTKLNCFAASISNECHVPEPTNDQSPGDTWKNRRLARNGFKCWWLITMFNDIDIRYLQNYTGTPWKINGWNLRIHPWKMKLIWTKPSFSGPTFVIRGVIYLYPPILPRFFQHFHQATLRSSPATRRASWFQSCQTLGK